MTENYNWNSPNCRPLRILGEWTSGKTAKWKDQCRCFRWVKTIFLFPLNSHGDSQNIERMPDKFLSILALKISPNPQHCHSFQRMTLLPVVHLLSPSSWTCPLQTLGRESFFVSLYKFLSNCNNNNNSGVYTRAVFYLPREPLSFNLAKTF